MEGKSNTGAIIFFIVFILVLVGVGFLGWKLGWYKMFVRQEPEIVEEGRLSLKAQDKSESFISVNYALKENKSVKSEGILKTTSWEEFTTYSNKPYTVIAWNDDNTGKDYYLSEESCNYNGKCIPKLEQEGKMEIKFLKIGDQTYNIRLDVTDGTVNDIKCLIRWSENIVIINNNLEENSIPSHLQDFWDKAYEIGDVNNHIDFQINFSSFPITENDYIEFMFIDECKIWNGNSVDEVYFIDEKDVCAENVKKKLTFD